MTQKNLPYYRGLLEGFIEHQLKQEEVIALLELMEQQPDQFHILSYEPSFLRQVEAHAATSTLSLPEDADRRIRQELLDYATRNISDGVKYNPGQVHLFKKVWLRYAAAILIIAVASIAYYNLRPPLPASKDLSATTIQSGKEGAILTLADGREIILDGAADGVIAQENGAEVVLLNNALAYSSDKVSHTEDANNTMTTPNGRQFQITLSDGTKVWLNAASSIRYPIRFSGNQRKVTITGEVYFEVAKNSKQPFFVNINDQAEVEVLGTSFNINAYHNEELFNTTLIEGVVRVSYLTQKVGNISSTFKAVQKNTVLQDANSVTLQPGQQARVNNMDNSIHNSKQKQPIKVIAANTEKVLAWKNGSFNFDGLSLQEAMKQLERWYDIEVVYENGIPDIHFVGEMSRGVTLTDLIKGLESTGIQFEIGPGRKLNVKRR